MKRFSEFHFTAKFWSFSLKKPFWMAGKIKFPAAIFLSPFLSTWKNHPCYYFVKPVNSKAFTTFMPVCKKHTRDTEIRPFCPGFRLKSVSFLSFSEKCKNQGSFCKHLIINKVLFLNLTEHGGSCENGACFYWPPFLSGKFTFKILTLQTYLVGGKKWKCWQVFIFPQWSIGIFTDILPSKIINSYRGNGGR